MYSLNENGTVRLAGIKPEMVVIIPIVAQCFKAVGTPCVITAATEIFAPNGRRYHMDGSKHDTGEALDFRTKTLTTPDADVLYRLLRERLTPEYQTIRHKGDTAHVHIEIDIASCI